MLIISGNPWDYLYK